MTTLSNPTLGLLIEIADDAERTLAGFEVETVLMRADLERAEYRPRYGGDVNTRQGLMRYRICGARERAIDGDIKAGRALLTFVRLIVEKTITDPENYRPRWFDDLCEALLADGYEVVWEVVASPGSWDDTSSRVRFKLLPTDPTPVALAPEITALEAELAARGYTTALNHYQQAVDGLINHKYESANGDLRATLEDLVTHLAEDHAGYQRTLDPKTGQPRANQGRPAINHLVQGSHLAENDGGKLLQGLWAMTHTHGSHPGHSDADEARFRMQIITGTARFLLKHFSAAP